MFPAHSPPAEDYYASKTAATQTGAPAAMSAGLSPPRTPPPIAEEQPQARTKAKRVKMGEFERESHFYPRVLNAQIHPLVQSFFTLGNDRIVARYTHLNPRVQPSTLHSILSYKPTYFQWAGLFFYNFVYGKKQRLNRSLFFFSRV